MSIKHDYKERVKPLITKSRFYRILFGVMMCGVVAVAILQLYDNAVLATQADQIAHIKSVLWMLAVWFAGIVMGLIVADGDSI